MAFTFNYEWLIFWTAIAGFGLGGEYGAAQALVSETVPSKQRGFWSSMLYGGAYIGIFLWCHNGWIHFTYNRLALDIYHFMLFQFCLPYIFEKMWRNRKYGKKKYKKR